MKRGDDVLIEGMAKQIRSLRKKNSKLTADNKRLNQLLEQIKPMARLGAKVFNRLDLHQPHDPQP